MSCYSFSPTHVLGIHMRSTLMLRHNDTPQWGWNRVCRPFCNLGAFILPDPITATRFNWTRHWHHNMIRGIRRPIHRIFTRIFIHYTAVILFQNSSDARAWHICFCWNFAYNLNHKNWLVTVKFAMEHNNLTKTIHHYRDAIREDMNTKH